MRDPLDQLWTYTEVKSKISDALASVLAERARQDEKWGVQDRFPVEWVAILTEEVGEYAKEALADHFCGPGMPERLRKELAERLRAEAVQCAAVALAIVECIDRNKHLDIK